MFFNSMPSVSVSEAAEKVAGDNVAFVDVRTGEEYATGHAKGTVNIPLDSFTDANVSELKQKGEVYVICQSGGRSAKAAKMLTGAGVNAINVEGGTAAWQAAGLPME